MKEFLYKVKPVIKVAVAVMFILTIGICLYFYNSKEEKNQGQIEIVPIVNNELEKVEEEPKKEEVVYIYVDVKGAVKKPGVYKLEAGSRVIDVINKSGGLSKDANTSVLNLSKKLEDGNVIVVYTNDYIEERKKQEVVIEYIEKDCVCPETNNDACIKEEDIIINNPENEENDDTSNDKKISLNTATVEELMTLPGIGESKAVDIINYVQQNGRFETIEEIKEVKGIGNALFEKIKDYITI